MVEGSPDLQGEVKALRAQLLEEQDCTAATKSQVDTLQRGLEEERTKMSQERQRYIGGGLGGKGGGGGVGGKGEQL